MSGPLVATDRSLSSFCGVWKRCLQTRVFGTFALARDANAIVAIDDCADDGDVRYVVLYGWCMS